MSDLVLIKMLKISFWSEESFQPIFTSAEFVIILVSTVMVNNFSEEI